MLARCMPIVLAKIIALSINREKTNNEIYGRIYVARSTAENDNATTQRVQSEENRRTKSPAHGPDRWDLRIDAIQRRLAKSMLQHRTITSRPYVRSATFHQIANKDFLLLSRSRGRNFVVFFIKKIYAHEKYIAFIDIVGDVIEASMRLRCTQQSYQNGCAKQKKTNVATVTYCILSSVRILMEHIIN